MRDASNILDVSAFTPDYMGFIFYRQSKRFFGTDFSLIGKVPGSIGRVGVFVNEETDIVLETAVSCNLNMIQLHGAESPEYCRDIRSAGYKIMKAFAIDNEFDFSTLSYYRSSCDYFLFDTKTEGFGGSGTKFDWELLSSYKYDVPFFISGGIGPADPESITKISNPCLFGVDINSRFEIAPGFKDVKAVRTFISNIRQ